MCLVALAIHHSRRFPLVVVANRDEFYARPSAPLEWWTPEGHPSPMLAGRDLHGGGTWLGLSAQGRLALVTNVRRGRDALDPGAPSRGRIVSSWLRNDLRPDRFWMRTALSGYNPFNLLMADFIDGQVFHAGTDQPAPTLVPRGLWGLSNGGWDEPWPKVQALKARLAEALKVAPNAEGLAARMLDALSDRTPAPDEHLPDTGVPLAWERLLSSAFIASPEHGYGTRCSTVVVTERSRGRTVTHVVERRYDALGQAVGLRRAVLRFWPPEPQAKTPPLLLPVTETQLHPLASTSVRRKRRRAAAAAVCPRATSVVAVPAI